MKKGVLIWVALGVLGLIAVTGIGLFVADPDRRLGAADKRTFATSNTLVEIGGVAAGSVKTVAGCDTASDVIKQAPGTDGVVPKHISQPKYEPCVLEVGSTMGQPLYDWIRVTLDRNSVLKNVTLIEADYNFVEKGRLQLQNAALTKVEFPALDATSRDTATIKLTLQPEFVQRSTSAPGTSAKAPVGTKQKAWLASNYRMTVSGGLPGVRIASISSLVMTQTIPVDSIGEVRTPEKQASKFELGDLTVDVSTVDTAPWDTWFHSFVVQGNNGQTDEKTATIEFLDPSLKEVLFSLSLKGVGIFRAGVQSTASEKVSSKSYSLYVEQAAFSSPLFPSGGTTGPAPAPPPPPPPPAGQAQAATISEALIVAVDATRLIDGETFTISDGTNEPSTFEFDLDGEYRAIPISISKGAPVDEVAGAITEAINGVADKLELTAKRTGDAQIQLVSARADAEGQEKILEFVEDESFKVQDKVVEPAQEKLPAPTELTAATGGEGEVQLSWQPSPGALGYLILFSTKPGGEYLELDKSEETKLTLAGLDSGVEHYFVVRALDGTSESANSNEASASAG